MREGPLLCVKLFFDETEGLVSNQEIEDYMLTKMDYINSKLDQDFPEGSKNSAQVSDDYAHISNDSSADVLSLLGKNNVTQIDDIPRFLQFVIDCGDKIDLLMNHSSVATIINSGVMYNTDDNQVSFNWIKCPAGHSNNNETYARITEGGSWMKFVETFRLSGAGLQEKVVTKRWVEHHNKMFTEHYSSYQKYQNMTRLQARDKA